MNKEYNAIEHQQSCPHPGEKSWFIAQHQEIFAEEIYDNLLKLHQSYKNTLDYNELIEDGAEGHGTYTLWLNNKIVHKFPKLPGKYLYEKMFDFDIKSPEELRADKINDILDGL